MAPFINVAGEFQINQNNVVGVSIDQVGDRLSAPCHIPAKVRSTNAVCLVSGENFELTIKLGQRDRRSLHGQAESRASSRRTTRASSGA